MTRPYTADLIVEAQLHGVRIDSFLVKHFRNYTPWRMQRLAAAGCVRVDHVRAEPTRRVFTGEHVRVRLIEPPDKLLSPEPVSFRLVYADPWLLIVDKPAGVITHPTGESQTGTLAHGIQGYLDAQTPLPGLLRPGIVHRLDRQTSGLMVIALNHLAHAGLSSAFESGRVSKTYVALVEGTLESEHGTITLPIGRAQAGRGVLMSARGDALGARPAITHYRVLQRFEEQTLVEARPRTGRNHQIRVHFAQIGHPLVGDEFYGAGGACKQHSAAGTGNRAPHRHALHAAKLEFAHPITNVWLSFYSPLPADVRHLMEQVKSSTPSECVSQ